jgi:hypothetical protein
VKLLSLDGQFCLSVQVISARILSFRLQRGLERPNPFLRCWQAVRQSPRSCHFPHLSQVRAPSLRRHYPASTVVRTHPPSAPAGAGPRGFAVDQPAAGRGLRSRLPLLRTGSLPCVLPPLPRWNRRVRVSLASPAASAFPVSMAGRLPHCSFRGLLSVCSRCGPHGPLPPRRGRFPECFRPFVTS